MRALSASLNCNCTRHGPGGRSGLSGVIATMFGKFELDPQSGQLLSDGLKTRLADQPLQILLYLLERRDDVVT